MSEFQRSWENRRERARNVEDTSRSSYYGMPVIKPPHWKWLIINYFFLGGLSAGSFVIAVIARLLGGESGKRIARAGHYISLAALIPSPILLILDLGRPERFLNMLRVLKLRSPMSVGTWGLVTFSGFCVLGAAVQAARDGLLNGIPLLRTLLLKLPHHVFNVVGSGFGFFVGGYTGVLLGATAVPLWAKNRMVLGPMFLASAMLSGVSAISVALGLQRKTDDVALRRLGRLQTLILALDVALHTAMEQGTGKTVGKPLHEGRTGAVYRWGAWRLGVLAPFALRLLTAWRGGGRRDVTLLSSLLALAGSYALRYSMTMGGRESAIDPQATFEMTRKREGN